MPNNMFKTSITNEDKSLGFEEQEVDNYETYFLSPPTVSAVVKNISPVERIIKTNTLNGHQEYLHQWKDANSTHDDGWFACCHNPVSFKNRYEMCPFYGKFQQLVNTYGTDSVNKAVLKKELSF